MHNKYATFVLPVLAGLAIVGAGFSTWVFANSNTATASATGSVTITGVESNGSGPSATVATGTVSDQSISIWSTFGLTLDQGGVSSAANTAAGITVQSGKDTIDFSWTLASADATAYSNYTVALSWTVSATSDNTYLSYAGLGNSSGVVTAQNITSGQDNVIYVDANIPNAWSYKSKPTNQTAYESMSSYFNGGQNQPKITISVTATYTLKNS